MEQDAAELVRRSRDGDARAFEALFRRYQNTIYRLALYLVGDVGTAEDVTQEAFVRAWERLDNLRDDEAFGGWLRQIALNLARDVHRRQNPEDQMEDEIQRTRIADDPGPAEQLVASETDQAVRRAVATLPEHQRLVVAMHHLEGMEIEAIAGALQLARGTVLSRLARGREMLRKKLARHIG